SQIKAKRAEAEMAMEGLENEAEEKAAEVDGRAAYKLLAETLGVNLNPTPAELKAFDYDEFKKQIRPGPRPRWPAACAPVSSAASSAASAPRWMFRVTSRAMKTGTMFASNWSTPPKSPMRP